MAKGAYNTADDCQPCVVHDIRACHQPQLRLFPGTGPLELLAINIPGQLPNTITGKQHVVVLKGRCTKLTRVIPFITVTLTGAATVVIDNCVIPYGIPTYVLTDNGPHFISKFFAAVNVHL